MPGVKDTINYSFTACRVGLRKCWNFFKCAKPLFILKDDEYKILCLGLSGAGKTTLLAHLVGDSFEPAEPTTGFNIKTLPLKDTVVSIKEVGYRVQPFWGHYFSGKNGILFVVDASSSDEELKVAKEALKNVFGDGTLKGKPCLILCTHKDIEHKSVNDVEILFQSIMMGRKWAVEYCSAYDRAQIIDALEVLIDLMTVDNL